jgi:hypothetical protein
VILQALFHVTAFQRAILSFRPVPYGWGAPKSYWKGFGEPVPGYIMRQVVTKRRIVHNDPPFAVEEPLDPPPSFASTPLQQDADLISFDSPKNMPSSVKDDNDSEEDNDNINESSAQDLPSLIVETPVEEEEEEEESTVEYVDQTNNELQLMPKCLKALAEMQKLFAFLGNTKRLYGSASHYVRALNTRLTSNGWEFSDKTFEGKKSNGGNAL